MAPQDSRKVVKGTFWSIIEVTSKQAVSFFLNIILARLLFPSDYGIIGIVLIFTSFADVIADGGLSVALIRKVDKTKEDEATAFWVNLIFGILVYSLIFILSPIIAEFFDIPELLWVIRITSISILFNSCSIVQNSRLISDLRLDVLTKLGVVIQILSGLIAVVMAYLGYGVWALVFQVLLSGFLRMVGLWYITKWTPHFSFSKKSFSYLWSFGSRLLLSNVIGTLYDRIYSFLIGKKVGSVKLGLYTRADSLGVQTCSIVNSTLSKVLIPYLKNFLNDKKLLLEKYMEVLEIVSFLIFPLMFLLIAISKPLFLILFGERWNEAVPIFKILCFGYAWGPFTVISLQLLQTLGDSKYFLKLELIKKMIQTVVIVVAIQFGFWGIVIAQPFYFIIGTLVNLSIAHSFLGSSYLQELSRILKYFITSIPIVLLGAYICKLQIGAWGQILIMIIVTILFYALIVTVFRLRAFYMLKHIVSSIKK